MKEYDIYDIRGILDDLPKDQIINILWSAMDYMESYNGRSKLACCALAMGYFENENGKWEKEE